MTWRVIVGTVSVVLTMILLGFVAVTETDRMASFTRSYGSRQIENGAAIFESNCQVCHGLEGKGVPAKGPALNTVELFNGTRTLEAGWAGTIDNFVRLTIAAGRPRPSEYYMGENFVDPMPTWGEDYGGPLRKDQVDALTVYIMNWGESYKDASGNFLAPTPTQVVDAVGTDLSVELPEGDAERGAELAIAQACTACHIDSSTGPAWLPTSEAVGMGARAEERYQSGDYTGAATSAAQYLHESIVLPDAYVVSGFQPGVMPKNFGEKLSKQDTADLIAYLLTIQ
jgi:mono/diheme cytochrome c family protein